MDKYLNEDFIPSNVPELLEKFKITPEVYTRRAKSRVGSSELPCFGLGLAGEAGEVADEIKKYLYHGKDVPKEKFLDECGDVLWYLVMVLDHFGWSLTDCMEYNDNKLGKRYPSGFSPEAAAERADEK